MFPVAVNRDSAESQRGRVLALNGYSAARLQLLNRILDPAHLNAAYKGVDAGPDLFDRDADAEQQDQARDHGGKRQQLHTLTQSTPRNPHLRDRADDG
jgi:hypothetical protein